jgi:sialate O-acetylesterase
MQHVSRFSTLAMGLFLCSAAQAAELLDPLFQDHAVLQRDRPVPVWGHSRPGDEITVSFNGRQATARTDANGHWSVELPAMAAGGPLELSARASSGAQTVVDVVVGDVWLCSGQSNMEMQVSRGLDSYTEIQRAANDSIRLLAVAHDTSGVPLTQFRNPVKWSPATSGSVADFSAVCFYFARELQKKFAVPMGLIHASWGGSRIEPWMSMETLQAAGGYDSLLRILEQNSKQPAAAIKAWGGMWETWWGSRVPQEQPWKDAPRGDWADAPKELAQHWEQWRVPALEQFTGMVWFRTAVELTAKQAAQSATLSLGKIDDADMSWLNGETVGSTAGPGTDRNYPVRKGLLKAGTNVIVFNALDLWGYGGPYGPSESRMLKLADGTSIPLDGNLRYRIVPKTVGSPPRAPWDATAGVTVIGNAMIAPLGHYRMRGVLWYQGESNTETAGNYQALLRHWMKEWRGRFGEDAAFLIVQLANFGPAPTEPVESGWADLREAQRRAVASDSNAGLAVTIDIGDRYDIHPANKQEVGRRLARAARHVVYGEAITPSGPAPVSASRDGNEVTVKFTDIDGGLVGYSGSNPVGFELCGEAAASCHYALARVEGDTVRLSTPEEASTPARVRFCWADSPVCTLYDRAQLPAQPFEISIE